MEIWSTIVAIFGFVGAAASEFHLLWATKTDLAGVEARMARTEMRARDMVRYVVEDGKVDVLGVERAAVRSRQRTEFRGSAVGITADNISGYW